MVAFANLYLRSEKGTVYLAVPYLLIPFVRKIISVLVKSTSEGLSRTMSDYNVDKKKGYNAFPALLGGLNLIVIIQMGLGSQTFGVGFWDIIFVLAGTYFSYKTARYIVKAHDAKQAVIRTQELDDFEKEGIYSKIRHPVGAAFIYFNIACVLLFRSIPLIAAVPVFAALWFILAKYQDSKLIERFGEPYELYMSSAGMFRGKGDSDLRLADSGYDIY
ncbi:MAG: isoprenylcysteine carboxylmethyltransferase family protein [Candidatus Thorarchaeota archaeon]|nr:isoprenylcysteine carboxylmethyltransferase family protein [Candidatus Thorarchaeota archaeon]